MSLDPYYTEPHIVERFARYMARVGDWGVFDACLGQAKYNEPPSGERTPCAVSDLDYPTPAYDGTREERELVEIVQKMNPETRARFARSVVRRLVENRRDGAKAAARQGELEQQVIALSRLVEANEAAEAQHEAEREELRRLLLLASALVRR